MAHKKEKIPGKVKYRSKRIQPTSPMPSGRGNQQPLTALAAFGRPERLNLVSSTKHGAPSLEGYVCTGSWRVNNGSEKLSRFREVSRQVGNTRTLYHGTPAPNIAAIVQEGLRPGRSACMFGSGIYLGGASKAFAYSGGGRDAHYIIEVEAALGKVWEQDRADHTLTLQIVRNHGFHSVAGVAGKTTTWGSGTLARSEYVIYSPDQVLPVRVFEYQLEPMKKLLDNLRSGGCRVLKQSQNPIPKGMQAFRDIYEEVPCGKGPTTPLEVYDGRDAFSIGVCAECITRLKLKKGDRIRIRRSGSLYGSRHSNISPIIVTIRGVRP